MRKVFFLMFLTGVVFFASCDRSVEKSLWFVDQALIIKDEDARVLEEAGVERFIIKSGAINMDKSGFRLEPTLMMMQVPENSFEWFSGYEITKGFGRIFNTLDLDELADFMHEAIEEELVYFSKSHIELSGFVFVCDSEFDISEKFADFMKIMREKTDAKYGLFCSVKGKWAGTEGYSKLAKICGKVYLIPFNSEIIPYLEKAGPRLLLDDYNHSFVPEKNSAVPVTPFQGMWYAHNNSGWLTGIIRGLSPDAIFEGYPSEIRDIRRTDEGEELVTVELLADMEIFKNKWVAGSMVLIDRLPFKTIRDRILSSAAAGCSIYSLPPEGGVNPIVNILKDDIRLDPACEITVAEKGGGRTGFRVRLENKGGGESMISGAYNIVIKITGGSVVFHDRGNFEKIRVSDGVIELSEFYLGPREVCESGIITVEQTGSDKPKADLSVDLAGYSGEKYSISEKYILE